MARITSRWMRLLAGLGALMGWAACGGLGPGDYLIYRVAYGPGQLGADCFEGEIPESVAEDSSTFHDAGTLVLYFDANEAPWLDTGVLVLAGSGGDDAYDFAGERVDTEIVPGEVILDSDGDGIADGEDPFVDADMDGLDDATDDLVDTDGDGLDDRGVDPLVDADGDGLDDRYTQLPSNTKLVASRRITIDLALDDDLVSGEVRVVAESRCIGDCPGQPEDGTCTTTIPFSGVQIEDAGVNVRPGTTPYE